MTLKKISGAALLALCGLAAAEQPSTLLLRQPAVSKTQLAFVFGGDIWVADRNGANPRQLTTQAAAEFAPHFSPDGRWMAFSANYDGNTDVYVMPAEGGAPRRLTWHPGADVVNGWSPDGKRVLFASSREVSNSRSNQLFEVALEGGFERKLMQTVAFEGAWSADGKRLAFRPDRQGYAGSAGWRQYRGGATPPIWIIDPASNTWEKVPHVNASDINPLWAGNEVIFISDRKDGAANLFAYNTSTKALRQLTHEKLWDVRSADVQDGKVVYETGGRLKELDLKSGAARELSIQLNAQGPRQQWKDVASGMNSAVLSATGKRVLVSARGDIFSVPVKDGSTRNLTSSAGVREKDGIWSPDGLQVAYISDVDTGTKIHHQLVLRGQDASAKPRHIALPATAYFTLRDWSSDGKTLALSDNHLALYTLDIASGALSKVDTSQRRDQSGDLAFSPDGRWLAYTVVGANHFSQVRLHELASKKNHPVTDGMSHAGSPAFSPKGDLLYFTASINAGPTLVGLDMSTQERPMRLGIYAAVLSAEGKPPLAPKAGEEEAKKDEKKEDKKDDKKEEKKDDKKEDKKAEDKKPTRIDVDGLSQRIYPLPLAERNYANLAVASDGALFYLDAPQPGASNEAPDAESKATAQLYRWDAEERKTKSVKTGVADFSLSADGKKALVRVAGNKLEVGDANEKFETKPVDLSGLRMLVDPRAEWRQIFDETWWMEKDFFYDPAMHGLDWAAVHARYAPLLAYVQRREDLNELLVEMIGEMQVGHNRVGGGDELREPGSRTGLLGADFELDQGRLKIAKVLAGDRWNPFLKAPLWQAGVKAGEYLLAVNGQELDAAKGNLWAMLGDTVGRQVSLTLAADAKGAGSRTVVVEPIANEGGLRQWDWVERNQAYVQEKSGGKVAYVYMPDTGGNGYRYFNRMFFAQSDKQALILDDRRNGGGQAANYVVEALLRPYLGGWKDRDGLVFETPGSAIYGPKAMLIDQDAGSGGDFMPYAFKRTGLGPLIGKRTWGGLIGISVNPSLLDGGALVVPYFRFFTPDGQWRIENEGVAPDIEVDLDPAAVNRGRDAQLDAAIANVLERLKTWKAVRLNQAPAMPTELGK